MKKLSLLLAVVFVFALTAVAQESGAASSSGQMSQDQTMSKKGHKMGAMGAKGSTLTGCVSKEANADGMYTLSNGRYKKGVEIGPADKVKDHAGHQVKLTGKWGTAAEAGEATTAASSSSKEKGERHFEVESVEHISDTCSTAPGGGTMGMSGKKKGKKSGDMGSNPQNPQ